MRDFAVNWHEAARTSAGLFWMAFWAFGLGYTISSMIQVFVTRERMKRSMGDAGPRSVGLGAFFGFISSSCSFAALATTRSLFAKGAGLVPSLAFLLASTNLVVELGIVIAVFLGWQFVMGEYLGGVMLILFMWFAVKLTHPGRLVEEARATARETMDTGTDGARADWRRLIRSWEGWRRVASRYVMEWHMVWKDVIIGFTVAGIIAVFVPRRVFQSFFIGAGEPGASFVEVLLQAVVAPIAAFLTFIGSMGNIPLAAVLYENGVSFAGIMAFVFSDLVVLPVLRIQAQYYGWRMAVYILGIFLVILVASAMLLHYGFAAFGLLPNTAASQHVTGREFFTIDYTFILNSIFLVLSAVFGWWRWKFKGLPGGESEQLSDRVLFVLACGALVWLGIGLTVPLVIGLA